MSGLRGHAPRRTGSGAMAAPTVDASGSTAKSRAATSNSPTRGQVKISQLTAAGRCDGYPAEGVKQYEFSLEESEESLALEDGQRCRNAERLKTLKLVAPRELLVQFRRIERAPRSSISATTMSWECAPTHCGAGELVGQSILTRTALAGEGHPNRGISDGIVRTEEGAAINTVVIA